jgi:hypothetical protein
MMQSTFEPDAAGARASAADDATFASAAPTNPRPSTSVVTRMNFAAPPEKVWNGLMFYEEIDSPPPLHLRLLLPVPIRTEGAKSAVGDVATCVYEDGHLLKRVTQIDSCRYYGFEVVEQNLSVGGTVLSGGCYSLRELPGRGTEVAITTRYTSPKRPGWLWKPIEATVCHMFHRHLLSSMRRKVEVG